MRDVFEGRVVDGEGRLLQFEAVPPQVDEADEAYSHFDWTELLVRAGIDVDTFTEVEPKWNPLAADARTAWEGVFDGQPDVLIRVETSQSLFTARYETGQVLRIPVAHHDGNYEADADTFKRLEDRDQIAFRYCERDGTPSAAANPNGSMANIAGVYNEAKTVLGLMPHPERLSDPELGGNDGRPMFDGLVEALS